MAPRHASWAAIAIALAFAGCGNPVSGKSEEDKIKDVVTDFVDAGNERDFATVCELLTYQRRTLQGGKECAKNFEEQAKGSKRTTTSVKIVAVRVSGTQAAVDAKLRSGDKGPFSTQQLLLQKQKGEWRIATAQ
jgi:ketosteroid isomerase-like protein